MSAEASASQTAATWPVGTGRVVLSEVDTTNAEAARRAAAGEGAQWILGLSQTAGRGRRGRPWVSPPGNFYGTLLMKPTGGPAEAALRSFIAALALRDALVGLTGSEAGIGLKWPNDVLVNGGKISGILLEGLPGGWLAVGIGVNLISAPDVSAVEPGATRPVSVLSETGQRFTPEELLDRIAPAFARYEALFRAYGFAPVREAWLAGAVRLGSEITARTGRETHSGIFRSIDATGALILETASGRIAIPAADIYF